jgi:hypothetical protein
MSSVSEPTESRPAWWKAVIATAVVLGLGSGLLWLDLGERIDGRLGNTVAWFVCPLAFPLLVSPLVALLSAWDARRRLAMGMLFVICFYIAHLLPLGVIIAAYFLPH